MISLIDAAQKILCLNPEAAKIFEDAESMYQQNVLNEICFRIFVYALTLRALSKCLNDILFIHLRVHGGANGC